MPKGHDPQVENHCFRGSLSAIYVYKQINVEDRCAKMNIIIGHPGLTPSEIKRFTGENDGHQIKECEIN